MNLIASWIGSFFLATILLADSPAPDVMPNQQKSEFDAHATGSFSVKVTPSELPGSLDPAIGRMTIDKEFHGDLEGTSKGEMIAKGPGGSKDEASAYVAIERVTGKLTGREGTFVLLHRGTMNAGSFTLDVEVAPGSGTGQLAGLAGSMEIVIADSKHTYDFAYTLPRQDP